MRGRGLFQFVEFGTRRCLDRFPCDIFAFEDRVEFDDFIALCVALRNDTYARHPSIGDMILDGHVCVVCPARDDSVRHVAARLVERQRHWSSSVLNEARESSSTADDRSHDTRKRERLRYVNVQTAVYIHMYKLREASADFPELMRASRHNCRQLFSSCSCNPVERSRPAPAPAPTKAVNSRRNCRPSHPAALFMAAYKWNERLPCSRPVTLQRRTDRRSRKFGQSASPPALQRDVLPTRGPAPQLGVTYNPFHIGQTLNRAKIAA